MSNEHITTSLPTPTRLWCRASERLPFEDGKSHTLRPLRILLIEDDRTQLLHVSRTCRNLTPQVSCSSCAIEALQWLDQTDVLPDVVLTDVQLPDITCPNLVPQIHKVSPRIMVIAMSVSEDPDVLDECISSGCADYIVKPVRQHELRLRLRQIMHAQERAATMRGQIIERNIHSMAHEFGTPLTTLKLAAEMLQAEMKVGSGTAISERNQQLIREIVGSIESLSTVCHKALDLDMCRGGQLTPNLHAFSLRDAVARQLDLSPYTSHYCAEVQYEVEISPLIASTVVSDESWVSSMVHELLTNAKKATKNGCIKLAISVCEDSMLLIEVSDTGIGVPEALCDTSFLFEKFVQLVPEGGAGTGLYILKCKVDALDGSCGCRRNSPTGMVVWFKVPYRPVVEEEDGGTGGQEEVAERSPRVLCVDDTPSILGVLGMLFRKWLIPVDTACNGEEALDLMYANEYDVVLCDVMMPVLDGLECVKRFREWEKCNRGDSKQLIFALTAQATASAATDCTQSGMDKVIAKPINKKMLLSHLNKIPSLSVWLAQHQ